MPCCHNFAGRVVPAFPCYASSLRRPLHAALLHNHHESASQQLEFILQQFIYNSYIAAFVF